MAAPQRALRPDCDTRLQGLDVHRHRVGVRGAGHFWKKRSLGRHIHTNIYIQRGWGEAPLGGEAPPGAEGPPQGLGRRPNNCSQATWVGVRRTPTQVAPTGQAVRVMVRHVRVMVRHVYIVPSESSHVEYP